MQMYMMEADKRTVYEEEMQKLRDTMRTRQIVELNREQCIDSVKHLEAAKLAA
jgi:hypothetical protein